MGPNIPSFTDAVASASSGANVANDVASLAPLATTWHTTEGSVNATFIQPQVNTNQGVLSKFGHFMGGIASEVGHLAEGATSWLAHQAVNMAEAPIKLGAGLGHAILDDMSFNTINAQSKQNSDLLNNVTNAYKSGRMTAQQYSQALKSINQDNSRLVSQTTATRNQTSIDQRATQKATWDTAATLVTVLTAGLGSAPATAVTADGLTPLAVKSAGDFLASAAAKPFFSSTEEFISRVASQPEVFNALSDTAKMALQRSAAEVVATGAKMTAPQIARASAVNLALKYPIYYGTIAPTGEQIYHQLDNAKYGDAVRTLAFNAALLLSGGPIGHALKYGGDAIKGISARTFGQTSFWDELSKFYGDGSPQGFRNAVEKATANMSEAEKSQFVRNLSAVEATNVAATGGDAAAAANRVATGMTANEGVSLSSVTHDEALSNMVNFAEAQRLADSAAQSAGLGKVAVGRVDARALNEISAKLSSILPEAGQDAGFIYHGTPNANIDKLSVEHANTFEPTLNRGVYTTGDKNLAESYASRNGQTGKLFKFNKPDSSRVFDYTGNSDIDKLGIKLSKRFEDKASFNDEMNKIMNSEGVDYASHYGYESARENAIFDKLAVRALKNMGDENPGKTWSELKHTSVSEMAAAQDDMATKVLDQINTDLRADGYDFVKHQGGIRAAAGDKLHDVYIALHDNALIPATETNGPQDAISLRLQAWEQLKQENPTQAWANNPNFDTQVKSLIAKHEDATSLDTAIRGIKAQFSVKGFPESVARKLAKMGYIPIKPVVNEAPFTEGSGKFISKFAGESDIWTKSVQPVPILGHIGSMLTGMGLSPNASTQQVYQIYNTALAKNLADTSIIKGSKMVGETAEQTTDTMIKRLSEYMHSPTRGGIPIGETRLRAPMTDLRQLSTKDIATALDISASDAKEVGQAIMQSMLDVPLSVRGLGDKAVDLFQQIPGIKTALRTQGALRFAWNPIFKAKVSTKIEILAQAEAGGKFPTIAGTNSILKMIFPDEYAKIDSMRGILKDAGALDKKSGFGFAGEASDAAGVSANLNHQLTVSQERSISSLILTQAKKAGMDGETFVKQFPQQVRDTVQMIAQYDRNANFLNSPMARTLNFAFFPFRFETKVATIMAKSLARTDTMTQLAVIKGLYNAHDFLNSPEGAAWYSQNSEVIKLAEYFTPIQTLGEVATALGGKADSISNFGELGGLPFGFIPQLLDAEGLTHITQSAYLDPKTGNELPSYVPATDKGKLLVAIQSLLGSMFSYPGSELGLLSKTSITRNIAMGLTGGNKSTDLKQTAPLPLSPEQVSFQQAVQAANPQMKPASTTTSAQMNRPVPSQTVPAQPTSATQPIPKSTGSSGGKRKKKADFTPALMPGQSQVGVIPGVQ